ncbi:MAG: serine/threonine-protein phosphatase [Polyangiaceae bacterium]|nr:serine/threonine-protein phosphatase [Polyangiaceae bacterium]
MLASTGFSPGKLVAAGATDPGRRRKHNEDAFLVRPDLGLYAVADGVGGHRAGEVASALALETLAQFFEESRAGSWPDSYRALFDLMLAPGGKRLSAAIRAANHAVHARANRLDEHQGMGTTLVAAHLTEAPLAWHVGHVGDSRAYRLRRGTLTALTRDHSVDNEPLLAARAADGPSSRRSAITRAIGIAESVELDMRTIEVAPGDVLLLCSDGLHRMLSDEGIAAVLGAVPGPREAAAELLRRANEAGGLDNVTAVVAVLPG